MSKVFTIFLFGIFLLVGCSGSDGGEATGSLDVNVRIEEDGVAAAAVNVPNEEIEVAVASVEYCNAYPLRPQGDSGSFSVPEGTYIYDGSFTQLTGALEIEGMLIIDKPLTLVGVIHVLDGGTLIFNEDVSFTGGIVNNGTVYHKNISGSLVKSGDGEFITIGSLRESCQGNSQEKGVIVIGKNGTRKVIVTHQEIILQGSSTNTMIFNNTGFRATGSSGATIEADKDGIRGTAKSGNTYDINDSGVQLKRTDGSTVDVTEELINISDRIQVNF